MGEVLGRFHPLIVHLPIGIFIAGFLMELAIRYQEQKQLQAALPFVLQLGIVTSLLALFTGWIMPKEGEFDEGLIGLHLWFSVAMTASSILVYLTLKNKNQRIQRLYFPLFILAMILLAVSGHFGGSLTHGEGHLTKNLTNSPNVIIQDINTVQAYAGVIEPILKKKCFGCHNESKKKGGLVMSNKEELMKGGDSGLAIYAGNPEKSPFIQNLHLPLDHNDHMPPEGKKQLTNNEIKLLEWWVATGASFNQIVGSLESSDQISGILKSYEQQESIIDTSKISILSEDDLNNLRSSGFKVQRINDKSPLIAVSASRDTTLTKGKLNRLKKYKQNIISLDLSGSNVEREMLSVIPKLKNLQRLRLQNTKITSNSLAYIEKLPILEYLNLYNTHIDDQGLEKLSNIPSLKSLYLWGSEVSANAVNIYKSDHPLIDVQFQIEEGLFGDAQLKPPFIVSSKEIFDDTINVSLDLNFRNVKIFYTMDGSDPDSTDYLYKEPILLNETATIKAISFKEGWITSEPIEKVFIKVGHPISSIYLSTAPNKKYQGKGGATLIDHEKGTTNFTDGQWLGYYGEDLTSTLDLGSVKTVQDVVVSTLEDTNSYIFFPKSIEVSTSKDSNRFIRQEKIIIPLATEPTPAALKSFLISFDKVEARFVQVRIQGTLKNPDWHPAPGAKSWFFVDEIMVN